MIVGMDACSQNPTAAGFVRRCADVHRADDIIQTIKRARGRERRQISANSPADTLGDNTPGSSLLYAGLGYRAHN